jgi:hypothetical protein
MSNSVPISFTPAPKIGHQTIGKNGSFWLPPDMQASSFHSHLKNYQGAKQPPAQSNIDDQRTSVKGHKPSVLTSSNQSERASLRPNRSTAKQFGLPAAKNHFPADTKGTITKSGIHSPSNGNLLGQIRNVGTKLIPFSVPTKAHPVQPSSPLLSHKSSVIVKNRSSEAMERDVKETITSKSLRRYLDMREDEGRRDGAKSASSGLSEESAAGKFKKIDLDLESLDLSDLHFNQSFSESVLQKLLPLLAHNSRKETDIVRFSYDLPDGNQATIRLEKVHDHLDVAVVCFNYENYPWIKESLDILFHKIESEIEISNDVRIFNSFEDFDHSNLRPLPIIT